MGALRPPNPPSGERPAAIYWRMPQRTAPIFSKTDDRLVNVIIMGASPHTPMRPFFMASFDFSKLK